MKFIIKFALITLSLCVLVSSMQLKDKHKAPIYEQPTIARHDSVSSLN